MARTAALLRRSDPPNEAAAYRLSHSTAPGAAQMAIDAALLAWAAGGPSRVAFRTYSWERPTLSLGRAEPFPAGWNRRALLAAGIDVVRRPTGGDAVLHDEELTFAVAATLPGPWRLRPRAFADVVAEALASALRSFDVPAERVRAVEPAGTPARPGEHLCFARAAAGEVRVDGFKAAGIASRFTRSAALSHASVPLGCGLHEIASFRVDAGRHRAALARHARTAAEYSNARVPAAPLGERLLARIAASLGVAFAAAHFEELGIESPGAPAAPCYRLAP